jgi:predicted ATPase
VVQQFIEILSTALGNDSAGTIATVVAPHKLSSIKVERFMSLRSVELEIRQLNVLIGPNGAGKSNFLSLFDLVGSVIDSRLRFWTRQRGGADRVLFGGSKLSPSVEVTLNFAGGEQGYAAKLAPSDSDALFFEYENVWGTGYGKAKPFGLPLGSGHEETKIHEEAKQHPGGVTQWTLDCMKDWVRYHFHDTSPSAGVKRSGPVDDFSHLKRDAANLAAFLLKLRDSHQSSYIRIRDAIRQVAPFFDDFVLTVNEDGSSKTVGLDWRHRDNDLYANASMLSDGTLRFMCLATVLLQPNPPSLLLIDEPELGLHPYAIALLAELLEAAATKCQIIVSTQSVTLLDRLSIDDVIATDRLNGATTLTRLDRSQLAEWLESYSVGELWMKNLLGARP